MAKVGQKIDDFEFEVYPDEKIKKMRLSDFVGKWLVLLFYPADFTFVCPTELEEAAAYYEEFKKAGSSTFFINERLLKMNRKFFGLIAEMRHL